MSFVHYTQSCQHQHHPFDATESIQQQGVGIIGPHRIQYDIDSHCHDIEKLIINSSFYSIYDSLVYIPPSPPSASHVCKIFTGWLKLYIYRGYIFTIFQERVAKKNHMTILEDISTILDHMYHNI